LPAAILLGGIVILDVATAAKNGPCHQLNMSAFHQRDRACIPHLVGKLASGSYHSKMTMKYMGEYHPTSVEHHSSCCALKPTAALLGQSV
jgi:hypothetical protein